MVKPVAVAVALFVQGRFRSWSLRTRLKRIVVVKELEIECVQ